LALNTTAPTKML